MDGNTGEARPSLKHKSVRRTTALITVGCGVGGGLLIILAGMLDKEIAGRLQEISSIVIAWFGMCGGLTGYYWHTSSQEMMNGNGNLPPI